MNLNLEAIRIEMAKHNVNQKQLADLAGIQGTTLSLIMTGKSTGKPDTWSKIAKALNISVKDIIED